MAGRPLSIYELLRFPRSEFGFPFPGWQREFGVYSWFYIRNLRLCLDEYEVRNVTTVGRFTARAVELCPESWKNEFPNGDWNSLAKIQINKAVNGGNIRFDKACLVILATEIAVNEHERDSINDVYELLYIDPAIFVVESLDDVLKELVRDRRTLQSAASSIGQSVGFIEASARMGSPMTYRSASGLAEFFQRQGYFRCEVRMLTDRTDRSRLRVKQPNPAEVVL